MVQRVEKGRIKRCFRRKPLTATIPPQDKQRISYEQGSTRKDDIQLKSALYLNKFFL